MRSSNTIDALGVFDAVVLASGINPISLFEGYVPGYKALIPYHGRTSVQYVLDALQGIPAVRRICIEGPSQLLKQELAGRPRHFSEKPTAVVEGGTTFLDSLVVGLEHFRDSPAVLLCAYAKNASDLAIAVVPRWSYTGAYAHLGTQLKPDAHPPFSRCLAGRP